MDEPTCLRCSQPRKLNPVGLCGPCRISLAATRRDAAHLLTDISIANQRHLHDTRSATRRPPITLPHLKWMD